MRAWWCGAAGGPHPHRPITADAGQPSPSTPDPTARPIGALSFGPDHDSGSARAHVVAAMSSSAALIALSERELVESTDLCGEVPWVRATEQSSGCATVRSTRSVALSTSKTAGQPSCKGYRCFGRVDLGTYYNTNTQVEARTGDAATEAARPHRTGPAGRRSAQTGASG
jgi:hypothetical protein